MATKPRKCSRCGQKVSEYISYKGKVFCEECFKVHMDAITSCSVCGEKFRRKDEYTDDTMSTADKKKTFCASQCYQKLLQDRIDMDELDNWLKEYHNLETLNSRIYMQINQFIKKNNFSYKGILLTLQYLVNNQKRQLQADNISLVAWYYDSAKEDYLKKLETKKKFQELQHSNFKMFNVIETKSSVQRQVDNRKDKILITDITFN